MDNFLPHEAASLLFLTFSFFFKTKQNGTHQIAQRLGVVHFLYLVVDAQQHVEDPLQPTLTRHLPGQSQQEIRERFCYNVTNSFKSRWVKKHQC